MPGAVFFQRFLQLAFDRLVVALIVHIDKVDHDQTGHVAQAKLAGDFLCRFQVGLQRGFLDMALPRGFAGVHVDGDQGLCLVDHNGAAGTKQYGRVVDRRQLVFNLIALEQGDTLIVPVALNLLGVAGDQGFHEILGRAIAFVTGNKNLFHVLGVKVTQGALDQIGFLVDQRGRGRFQRTGPDMVPQFEDIIEVAADFCL